MFLYEVAAPALQGLTIPAMPDPFEGFAMKRYGVMTALVLGAFFGCHESRPHQKPKQPESKLDGMDTLAEAYAKLVLALGVHDPDYVDAFYGPVEWRTAAEVEKKPLAGIREEAVELSASLDAAEINGGDLLDLLRRDYLRKQLRALAARVDMLMGEKFSFDTESELLYDAVSPHYPEAHYRDLRRELETLVPGEGDLTERLEAYRQTFAIPKERLDAVFQAALAEARKRTANHISLPEGESFEVEYVTDKPWSGYNWYKGNYHSLIQVNTDLPIFIDRAVDLACHEGYPGHHVYNVLLERDLVRGKGWREFTVYPLFSPQSLIAEGTANFGIQMAFPGRERIDFEKEILFPLAGIDPASAENYYRIMEVVGRLNYAGNEAARGFLDGEMDSGTAVDWLHEYALFSTERAQQRLKFIEKYRSYVINYNLGQDLVFTHVEAVSGGGSHSDQRWEVFRGLISSPRIPSQLQPN